MYWRGWRRHAQARETCLPSHSWFTTRMPVVIADAKTPGRQPGVFASHGRSVGDQLDRKGASIVSRHRARTMLGSGIFRFTTDRGSVYLPLKPDLLALVAALHERPVASRPHRGVRPRDIPVYAR